MAGALIDRLKCMGFDAGDPAVLRARQELFREGPAGRALSEALGESAEARALFEAVFAGSPFLTSLILADPAAALSSLMAEPETRLGALCEAARQCAGLASEPEVKVELRRLRAQAALLIALADLGGVFALDEVTSALTRFADACLAGSVDFLLGEAARQGRLIPAQPAEPGKASGYVVLAMGKHGAGELNYSSDIDLIVLFDPETAPLAPGIEPAGFFVRLTKRLAGLLQDRTEHGYVFRVDLRLRPDPGATQIAIAYEAAALYYENQGQNWERAAMIKARPAAGDLALGHEFLARLRPYVWRKHLDFAAIADIQSLKRQIHAVKGHGEIAVRGHNIKLGRGGIREIEFFVQTQQLIAGGRNPALRERGTLIMLGRLADAGWITQGAAAELAQAYRDLRTIEHRIQMREDAQTHTLPEDEAEFARLARFCGEPDAARFESRVRATLDSVQRHYAALFEDAPDLGTEAGDLVFTGGEDDPGTLATLARMGFSDPRQVAATIRGWHFGRFAATRSARARELLTELMPALLNALAQTGDADQAFLAFDRFLASLPAGVQLFSLLRANPKLLGLIATVLGAAPRLAELLSQRPQMLDAVIDRSFFGPLPRREDLAILAAQSIPDELTLEEAMDRARVMVREQAFRIGVRVLSDTVESEEAGAAFSALAQSALERLLAAAVLDHRARHGEVDEGRCAIIAMGKLGGEEMTAASDLDLVFVYDAAPGAEHSHGPKPLSVNQYYTRLAQRLIAALTSPTSEGILYEVDMRLRPSGSKGPVATSLASFRIYHESSAWTWERLALTRARVVAGDPRLADALRAVVAMALRRGGDHDAIRSDVLAMRRLMLQELGSADPWDIKRRPGGLVDVEFIAQTLQLLHARDHAHLLAQGTRQALARLHRAGLLGAPAHDELQTALGLYQRLTQVMRLTVSGRFEPASAPRGLLRLVSAAAQAPDIAHTQALLEETCAAVTRHFEALLGPIPVPGRP